MTWVLVLLAYITYAILAFATTGVATKAWVATGFAVVSVALWAGLHFFDRKRRR